ncbi:DUF349 domain-containing protein [Flavobacterium gawalongense]|uniref:DUF349 domain-containing protein n=1 Tax=Flavobacterium gawalongense TaxID=2594432 RepID=A0ABY3CU48_9FLAO|nr:DUF349 domain-containing protein [Flavobacterium gawalongense]TRX02755.1 DUF349 domain-containing protein [Flavobacterium gawalongense]TRX08063.1 DUF349 domain-containing protein [Flavobacterium gawalongense]
MLEEKNDNLLEADGNLENNSVESSQSNTEVLEKTALSEPIDVPAEENVVIPSNEELPETAPIAETENQTALDAIAETNAAESEDETLKERHDIPMQDYDTLSLETLVEELKSLVSSEKVMSVKDHIEEIKKAFLAKYNHLIEEKKEEFLAENQDPNEEFQYHSPLKTQFDKYYSLFRDTKNTHFKSLQTNLKTNLENRLVIVEELKELINPQENIKDTLKHFNDLRERWKNAGPIPKDKYNHVWNNFHFHVENFYDYLHLDREARDLDFKHNLEQKQKIVARVEELVKEADVNKAFRELQDLHRIWKEDIGPVSREHRDAIWNKFSDLTKQMHDKREVLFENQRGTELENLEKKKEIISKIEVLATEKVNAHSQWLTQIEKVEALRTAFFSAGKVPSDVNEETWASFKTAVRNFNSFKNSFYKDIKKDQNDNLCKKTTLVAKAKELQESTDFAATTPIMKQIQDEWKQIGHVPRKYSDKIWKEFKDACNHYFDKLKEQKNEENSEEVEAFDNKKTYLETLREYQLTGDHKTDLDAIKLHIETWKNFGKVPFPRRHIEGKFNKILDALFEKLSLSKKDTDMIRFANRMDNLSESNDTRKLDNEKIFLMRKIDEVQNEIFQLENNIQFFTNTRNAKKENSIVLEVRKNIAIHKESLDVWKEKLKQLRNLKIE